MSNKLSLHPIKSIARSFRKFNVTLFIVMNAAVLIYAVWSLSMILNPPSANNDDSSAPSNQAIINRLNQMTMSSASPSSANLPSGRINPFSE